MMNRVKILFGLEACEGGAAVHLLYILKNINRNIFEITVIASKKRSYSSFYIEEFKKHSDRLLIFSIKRELNFINDLTMLFRIRRFLNKNKFNIIHLHSSKAGFLFRVSLLFKKIRPVIIYTPHHYYFQSLKGIKKYCFIALERFAGKFTDFIIAVSEHEKIESVNNNISKPDKIILIKNAIDIDYDTISRLNDKATLKQKLKIPIDNFVIGAVGRFTKQKDWLTFLKICKSVHHKYNNITFLLIGYGELKNQIIDLIHAYGLTDNFINIENNFSIHHYYLIMDVFVNTSLWEGFSYTLLEAMAMKRCIIASNIPGNDELIINGENGYLIGTGDIENYTKLILELIQYKKQRIFLGEMAAKTTVKNNSIERFITSLQELYLKKLNIDS